MIKRERLETIIQILKHKQLATVGELARDMRVSKMTIRRDLDELSAANQIIRVHGGARYVNDASAIEINYEEKREIHIAEKKEVAKKAGALIEDGSTVYVGPGTTLEFMVTNLKQSHLRIVTNSLPVFNAARANVNNYDLILIGGVYRRKSGAFIGAIANKDIRALTYDYSFIGVNGLINSSMMTANMEEGLTQAEAMNRSKKRFVVTDRFKLNKSDFYDFYSLRDVDQLITNKDISQAEIDKYSQYTKLNI